MNALYDATTLAAFAADVLAHAGLDTAHAKITADVLLEGDLMGHSTHGLALLAPYAAEVLTGRMRGHGEPEIVAETAAAQTWDGRRLPGPWLVHRAANWAVARSAETGIASVSIRRSCHIGCLAAYLRPAAEAGRMLLVACSDPSTASVAPFGGTRRLYTPNPLAAGWPSPGGPVMLDVSMSITTNGMTGRRRAEGRAFDHPWLMDAAGNPTGDPETFYAEPGGTLLPLGGMEAGHKGFALGLLVEALTSALGGFGRADAPTEWGASVLVLAIDPARFGGAEGFLRETGWMADAVHANLPRVPGEAPRLPGERALALRTRQLREGVALHPSIPPALAIWADKSGLPVPQPIA